jgi:hypothetical protein
MEVKLKDIIVLIGKITLVSFTILFAFIYSMIVLEKIQRPTWKNLQTDEIIILGIFLACLIMLNLHWTLGLFRKKEKIE